MACLESPEDFSAVGLWYDDFDQTSDEDVRALLDQNRREREARFPSLNHE